MRLFTTAAALRCFLVAIGQGKEVGLVPTMGALHEGHISLITRARRECDLVVVSIFVNPLQFGPNEDYQRYPRALERDRELCEAAGVDVIFTPSPEELFPEGFGTQVEPPLAMRSVLCGRSRPQHFEGVATIVTKLLNLVQPQRAYFGQKDAQQLAILQRLVADLNIPTEIVPCPIVREPGGLALSSRNQYLTESERNAATVLYRALREAEQTFKQGERDAEVLTQTIKDVLLTEPTVQPEYVELVHPQTLAPLTEIQTMGLLAIAARVGPTRLIDNLILRWRKPIIAIDGPAGAGKSTVARAVARQLNLLYLDTGAMYRAVTWLMLETHTDSQDEPAVAELLSHCNILLTSSDDPAYPSRVWVNDHEVSHDIRTQAVTAQVSAIAALSVVRAQLVRQQQQLGLQGGLVMEGRDIGTRVFPDAELKVFLTASVQERARRRQQDLRQLGEDNDSLLDIEQAISHRDALDSNRELSPLRKANDAIELCTDGCTIDQVTNQIVNLYQQFLAHASQPES
ncbi:bifunctional pantoate--beta-alanine ligase/(d)CMP kinase [Leptolyngbya sp. FACHB-261]|uniref:bifunctional pantoate--beta-alanine ligase/(d)CMP kinase n=1 Tax=Leptolyngbya sp. FACHB-261 TaxID=2692806 RepID=UPI001683ABED|nr:bifunctional pantoate--beta-alanine ligase/(d)CMP kinase [Leptolyngbya sp. FACHB-261]MBD2100869.1 bifunctional pantoate--beta-alanine ligase/(d)CMP kinase [Leptolyngbya sp. FACHB-261]